MPSVKNAHARGTADALAHFKLSSEELRLQIPKRSFHGYESAKKTEAKRSGKQAGDGMDADTLAKVLETIEPPKTPGDETRPRDALERTPAWSAPTNPSGGNSSNIDVGQPTGFGGI